MQIIKRPRNSGKTTMLLHYMELVPEAILIVGKEALAGQARKLGRDLGLSIADDRIFGMTDAREIHDRAIVLIDNVEYIIGHWPERGFGLIKQASIIVINRE